MARFILLPLTTDPRELAEGAFDYMRARVPGIELADGHAETLLIEANAQMVADVLDVLSGVPAEAFRYFGRSLVGIPPGDATPATGTITATATAAGTIEDGVELFGVGPDGYDVAFRVVGDHPIAAGQTLAGIPVEAIEEGSGANSVSGLAELVGQLDFVSATAFEVPTQGGQDPEADDAYLDRLASELRLMAPRPILPGDFATLARRHPQVERCLAIDGLNPADGTTGNARMVALFPIDAAGQPVSAGVRAELTADLQAQREVNFLVPVGQPTYTAVAVAFTATAWPGYDAIAVRDAAIAAVSAYLSPSSWGQPPYGDERDWTHEPLVAFLEVAEVLNRVDGLRRVTNLTLNGQANADVVLAGVAPLPTPGAITGTVTATSA